MCIQILPYEFCLGNKATPPSKMQQSHYFDTAMASQAEGFTLPRGAGIICALNKWVGTQFGFDLVAGDVVSQATLAWMHANGMFNGTVYRMKILSVEAAIAVKEKQQHLARACNGRCTQLEAIEALERDLPSALTVALRTEAIADAAAKLARANRRR